MISILLMKYFNTRSEMTLNYEYLENEEVLKEIKKNNLSIIEGLERRAIYGNKKNE